MSNNESADKPIVYPEQENPPRPTYTANLRGLPIGGWLYYHPTNGSPDNGQLNIVVTIDAKKVMAEDFIYTNDQERRQARLKAKNVWRKVVLAVLAGV